VLSNWVLVSPSRLFSEILVGHFEEFVDEPILTLDVTPAQPPHLVFPNYVHRLIALNRSSRSLEFAEPLLSLHSPFDRAMVLLDDVVQILDGSVAAPAAERPFLFLNPALRRLCFRQATSETSEVEIDRLTESPSVLPGQVAGRCRSRVCHDRTIHTFDSLGNAIWVRGFSDHRL
jgi:hypothetical protein